MALPPRDVLELLKNIDEIHATKMRTVMHFDLRKDHPGMDALLRVLIGPTGKLRSPAIRRGRMLIVGFNEEMYRKALDK